MMEEMGNKRLQTEQGEQKIETPVLEICGQSHY